MPLAAARSPAHPAKIMQASERAIIVTSLAVAVYSFIVMGLQAISTWETYTATFMASFSFKVFKIVSPMSLSPSDSKFSQVPVWVSWKQKV